AVASRLNVPMPHSGRPPERGPSGPLPEAGPAAEKALRSFNTWAFKREQPADPQLMLQTICAAIAGGEPISFVLYWGKGPRCGIADPDIQCLDYLATLGRRVREAYEHGAAVNLVFTDTHAELNGHSQQAIDRYFGTVDAAARERGFATCRL